VISRSWVDPDGTKKGEILQQMMENIQTGQTSIDNAVKGASGRINLLFSTP